MGTVEEGEKGSGEENLGEGKGECLGVGRGEKCGDRIGEGGADADDGSPQSPVMLRDSRGDADREILPG